MVARALVATADERTWPEDRNQPVLFLGEWCRCYSRKKVWQNLNAEVALYHWDDRKKLFEDYQYLQVLYEKLLAELSDNLNRTHSVDHSLRYWRILIGPWLGNFVQILFDRWYMLKQTIENTVLTDCLVIERDISSVVPNDMARFQNLSVDDDWNEAIYSQLLELCWGSKISIKRVSAQPDDHKHSINTQPRVKAGLKKNLESLVSQFNRLFSKDDAYFFISSYFPLKTEFKLQIRLGQFPKLWRTQPVPVAKYDSKRRQWQLCASDMNDCSFEYIARELIPLHIPTAYLEGYKRLVTATNQMAWPKKPKGIFTSNAYFGDDLFKAWAAEKTEHGTPLIIGQHGGHFGMNPFSFHEEHQIGIADKWLSWGWSDKARPKIIPVGYLKSFGRTIEYDPNGGALMVEMTVPRYSYHMYAAPVSRQWLDYLEDQKAFLKTLPFELREQVLLRLYHQDYGWDQTARWKDQMPEVHIDPGQQNIHKLMKKCRLYISTYNATTYLESLTWNIPTIIFWNTEHWELSEDVWPYFDLLESVGIFHKTPESAARQMAKVWDDIPEWWNSDTVQNSRSDFCNRFSRIPEEPLDELESIFRNLGHQEKVA